MKRETLLKMKADLQRSIEIIEQDIREMDRLTHIDKLFASVHIQGNYDASVMQVNFQEFTDEQGYHPEDIKSILSLEIGEQWTDETDHLIIRIK